MIVAIDGAVKAPGKPECLSVGCALFPELDPLYKVKCEPKGSTSQRGEINGLILALDEALERKVQDDILLIVTDSEYLYNTVMGEWVQKWAAAGWIAANGEEPKNADQWKEILTKLSMLAANNVEVSMLWTKGHLYRYPAGQATRCMQSDASGATLMSSINTMLSVASQRERAVEKFNAVRNEHSYPSLPEELAAEYILYNTTVDAIAVYCANVLVRTMADYKEAHTDHVSDDNK